MSLRTSVDSHARTDYPSENISGHRQAVDKSSDMESLSADFDADDAASEEESLTSWNPAYDPQDLDAALNLLARFSDNPPGNEGDADSTDEDESDLPAVALKAMPDIESLQIRLANAPPALKDDLVAQRLVKELREICDKAAERAALPKKKEQSLHNIREGLERRREMLMKLEAHGNQAKARNGKDKLLIVEETLGAFDIASAAIRHNSGAPTRENIQALSDAINYVQQTLDNLANDATMAPDLRNDAVAELGLKLNELKEMQFAQQDYVGPGHQRKLIEERMLYVDAACEIFESLLRDASDSAKGKYAPGRTAFDQEARKFLSCLQARRNALDECIAHPRAARTGKYEAEFLSLLMKKDQVAFETIALDDQTPEAALMAAVVNTFLLHHPWADFRSGKELIAEMKKYVLNRRRDWSVISSELLIPMEAAAANAASPGKTVPAELAKATTVTTPAGHVFNAPGMQVLSTGSAITAPDLNEYRQPDPTAPGKTQTTGFNSHSTTEHKHGVNVARSEISVAGKTLFSGTRHATLSAYELYPDTLKKKPLVFLKQMFSDLTRKISEVTQICTSAEIAAGVQSNPPPYYSPTEFDMLWQEATDKLDEAEFIAKAKNDEKFGELLRRKSALNRAREVFLSEMLANPALLSQIRDGKPVVFTSISLITPDPFRNFLAKLLPSKFRVNDELSMRRDEAQAWKDLQAAIDKGQIEIDGQAVRGKILSFSVGVNQLSLGESMGAFGRWLTSGWNQVAQENSENFDALVGDPAKDATGGKLGEHIREQLQALGRHQADMRANRDEIASTAQDIKGLPTDPANRSREQQALMNSLLEYQNLLLNKDKELTATESAMQSQLTELTELREQLTEMWRSGAYRRAGEQPYKFAARLARLACLMGSGIAYNCKSGKDRTAQLDLEVKLMSVQNEYRRSGSRQRTNDTGHIEKHGIVPPYTGRTDLEKRQLQAFIFQDKTRTSMQRYNTGVEGSKLNWWQELYASFLVAGDDHEYIGQEFRGRSQGVAT